MTQTMTRRGAVRGAGGMIAATIAATALPDGNTAFAAGEDLAASLARIAAAHGGRVGIAVLDTATGAIAGHRSAERFPMCSTFKFLASAAVLARVDAGQEDLNRRIHYAASDLVTYSPATKLHADGTGMTLGELCAAALTLSDNTAGNLLLASLGGPPGLTAFARAIGDTVTRLDRTETALNEAIPGDPRDTTTPAAMATNLRSLVLGGRLSETSRAQLAAWLLANKTGDAKLRAGVPHDWRVGDKTAAGDRGTVNDIGVLWPPRRAPLIVCVYITDTAASFDASNAAIADIARAVAAA